MSVRLPERRHRNSRRPHDRRRFPGHRAWVRGHGCSVPGCTETTIECAHVRDGTDGGIGLKPSDWWTLSLCTRHHAEQHRIGEAAFEQRYGIDLKAIAQAFARRSPHRHLWHDAGDDPSNTGDSTHGADSANGDPHHAVR